ncbi:MarR family transcriptional regulator [Chryseobacterium sp. POL2]|uniref:SatD family protein n=1 Tax=Chryseobacterium sp. POL2 TaxID=2713414 RepID=UPI0013E159CB|nr:SatD family protein [Chryseobacterium sp. POL2]QIG90821.1 MarR family transcriptional regulator [Chryseobacterium sp. POL2]
MKAVITGDIIDSQKFGAEVWFQALQKIFEGKTSQEWENYRGDEFQYLVPNAEDAFLEFLKIKAGIKKIQDLDVRISIGLGDQNFVAEKVSQSNGTAFVNSGRNLERIKAEKVNLHIASEKPELDEQLNLIFKWVSLTLDSWSVMSAEIVEMFLCNPNLNQDEAARQLNVTQSSISQRLKRANYDLLIETEAYYRQLLSQQK